MFRIIPFALAAALAIPASARAWVEEDIVNPSNLETVTVKVFDDAEGGCWTNIGETRTYAEDKLSELGYTVVKDPKEADFRMNLSVLSNRSASGCWGYVDIQLKTRASLLNGFGLADALVGEVGRILVDHDNANILMLDVIKELTDEMESAAEVDETDT